MASAFATLVVRKTFLELQQEQEPAERSGHRARAMTDSILASTSCWASEAETECSDDGSTADTAESGSGPSWADCESPRNGSGGRHSEECACPPQVPTGVEAEPEETRTTLIIKGMPTSFKRNGLLELLRAQGFGSLVDFAYVPMDFRTMETCGFGFVNFTSVAAAQRVARELHGVLVEGGSVSVAYSEKDQGLPLLVDRHRNSPLMHHSLPEEYRPLLLRNGLPVPFPAPTKKVRLQSLMQQVRRRQRSGM